MCKSADPSPDERLLQIGDTVKIVGTEQIGKIVAYERGRWKVSINEGNTQLVAPGMLQHRDVLFG